MDIFNHQVPQFSHLVNGHKTTNWRTNEKLKGINVSKVVLISKAFMQLLEKLF